MRRREGKEGGTDERGIERKVGKSTRKEDREEGR